MGSLKPSKAAAVCLLVIGSGGWTGTTFAQLAVSPPNVGPEATAAQVAFEAGVLSANDGDWLAAVSYFRASMDDEPRVAAAFNLVVALGHLERNTALLRAADEFLELVDSTRHVTHLAEIERLRRSARERVGEIRLIVSPADATVHVDGLRSSGTGPSRVLYVEPGPHVVLVDAAGFPAREIEVSVGAGSHVQLDATLQATVQEPLPSPVGLTDQRGTASSPRTSLRSIGAEQGAGADVEPSLRDVSAGALALLGGAGWLAGIVLQVLAWVRADEIAAYDPTRGGFISLTDEYRQLRVAVIGLAVGAGTLLTTAEAVWDWEAGDPPWWLSLIGGALVAAGVGMLVRSPDRLGETRLTDPVRALGSLFVSTGAPLIVAPLTAWANEALREVPSSDLGGVIVMGDF